MARSGRKTIKIDAPIMVTADGTPVWMDNGEWAMNFFDWLAEVKLNKKLAGIQYMHNRIKLTFVSPKDCTAFSLRFSSKGE